MKRAIFFLVAACALHAETWPEMKHDCTNDKKTFFVKLFGCVADAFQLDGPHAIVHSFPPPGSIGFGLGYSKPFSANSWERSFTSGAAVSIRGFWYVESRLTVMHIGKPTGRQTDEKTGFHLYGNVQDLSRLPFYGLGPHSSLSNLTNFHERIATVGGDLQQPLNNYFTAGVAVEGLIPDISPTHSAIPSIETKFNELTAPGLADQPVVVRYNGFLRLHGKVPDLWQNFEDKVSYGYYQDTSSGHYSFRRFRADVNHTFFPFPGPRHHREDRSFSIRGILSLSDTATGNAVPFYLQETLGGTGIDGNATLRAFDDYRFRAPYLAVIQTEYAHRLWSKPRAPGTGAGPLGDGLLHTLGLFAFYDVGQVALRRGDLDIGNMRHSVGGGIAIFVGGFLQAKIFVGLGGGEGHHTYTVIPKI
jgi:hypothetical protein